MAKSSDSSPSFSSAGLGPKLIGGGVAVFVLTRIINWLPLGLLGSWINGILLPIWLLAVIAGAVVLFMKSKRS